MSRTFCCCLPVRFGVFVLSFLQLLFGGAAAGLLWFEVIKNHALEGMTKTTFIVAASLFSVIALSALAGFIGAISRSRGLVATYGSVLYVLLFLNLAVGVWLTVMIFRGKNAEFLQQCQEVTSGLNASFDGKTTNVSDDSCSNIIRQSKWIYLAETIVQFIIQLYLAHIVSSYAKQLSEEQAYRTTYRNVGGAFQAPPPASYYPHAPLEEQKDALLQPAPQYPYADKQHSFGPQP